MTKNKIFLIVLVIIGLFFLAGFLYAEEIPADWSWYQVKQKAEKLLHESYGGVFRGQAYDAEATEAIGKKGMAYYEEYIKRYIEGVKPEDRERVKNHVLEDYLFTEPWVKVAERTGRRAKAGKEISNFVYENTNDPQLKKKAKQMLLSIEKAEEREKWNTYGGWEK